MISKKLFCASALFGLVVLSACGKDDSSVSADELKAASTVSAAASGTAAAQKTLKSRDGSLSIDTAGNFQEAADAANTIADIPKDKLILLQRDNERDITLYAAALGTLKAKPDAYFAKLKSQLEADKTLKDLKVEPAADNRMAYQFSQNNDDGKLKERCVAIAQNDKLYSVCADSERADFEALGAALGNIQVH